MTETKALNARSAPFWRRCAALLYDSALILACIMIWGFVVVALNRGEALHSGEPLHVLLQGGILFIWFIFLTYFSAAQRQSLGMRAWRLLLLDASLRPLSYRQAATRAALILIFCLAPPCVLQLFYRWTVNTDAPLGLLLASSVLAFFGALFDPEGRSLYERLSHSKMLVLDRNPYRKTTKKDA